MNRQQRPITDRELEAWLAAGPVDRGVGEGLTFVASSAAAQAGKASWILRYRLNGHFKEKVLGRYPELSLKDAREQARQDRSQIERGIDVAAAKQEEKALLLEVPTVQRLGEVWFAKYIQPRYKHPESRRPRPAQAHQSGARVGRAARRTAGPHRPRADAHRGQRCADRRQRRASLHEPDVPDGRPQPLDRTEPGGRLRLGGCRRRRGLARPLVDRGRAEGTRPSHADNAELRARERAVRVAAACPVRPQDGVAVGPLGRIRSRRWHLDPGPRRAPRRALRFASPWRSP
jgi:Arm DNA-binding domain